MIQVLLTLLLMPLLRLAMRPARRPPERILVIQMAKIGDAVCTSPLLRQLRLALPRAHVAVLAPPLTQPMFRHNPRIDRVIVWLDQDLRRPGGKLRLSRALRAEAFDAVICCNGGSLWPIVTTWAGIPTRIGIVPNYLGATGRLSARLWTAAAPHRQGRLVMATYADMLGLLGMQSGLPAKEVFASAGAQDKVDAILGDGELIGIAVSSGNKLKELGRDKLATVAATLLAARPTCRIVLLGSGADRALAQELLVACTAPERVIDACGAVELAELPELLARLALFVGVDSGLTYMADALDIPLVSVAGPADMEDARPLGRHATILKRELPCAPCSHYFRAPYACRIGTRECIKDITAEEISTAALKALEEQTP